MKKISLTLLIIIFVQSVFAQQMYYEAEFELNSTPIDSTLYWYGVYQNPDANPRLIGDELILKPVNIFIKRDSLSFTVRTNYSAKSEYLFGFKKLVNIDSFPDFHFLSNENYYTHLITAGSEFDYNMNEMGRLKMYANGTISRQGDSIAINKYDLIIEHQCYATPYATMFGWQYNLSFDVYAPCKKESLNTVFNLSHNKLKMSGLPYFFGAIDLNQDELLDLLFIYKGEHYFIFSNRKKESKSYIREVKKMKLDSTF